MDLFWHKDLHYGCHCLKHDLGVYVSVRNDRSTDIVVVYQPVQLPLLVNIPFLESAC